MGRVKSYSITKGETDISAIKFNIYSYEKWIQNILQPTLISGSTLIPVFCT